MLEETEQRKQKQFQNSVDPFCLANGLWLPFRFTHTTGVLRPKDALMRDSLYDSFLD